MGKIDFENNAGFHYLRILGPVKYKVDLADSLRIKHQYLGFLATQMPALTESFSIEPFRISFGNLLSAPENMPSRIVLGKRAEHFLQQALSQSKEYDLLASGIQLISDGITQGELDFLIYSHLDDKCYHVEMAYKLYLFDESASHESGNWVGPNRRDSLKLKLEKLQNSQFPKFYSPVAKKYLEELSIDSDAVVQKLYMPMQLFIPYRSGMELSEMHTAPDGEWLSIGHFLKESWDRYLFFVPEKQDWFVNPKHGEIWLELDEVLPQIFEKLAIMRSPMVWMKMPSGFSKKLFITFW